jgi:hypothetical protein
MRLITLVLIVCIANGWTYKVEWLSFYSEYCDCYLAIIKNKNNYIVSTNMSFECPEEINQRVLCDQEYVQISYTKEKSYIPVIRRKDGIFDIIPPYELTRDYGLTTRLEMNERNKYNLMYEMNDIMFAYPDIPLIRCSYNETIQTMMMCYGKRVMMTKYIRSNFVKDKCDMKCDLDVYV